MSRRSQAGGTRTRARGGLWVVAAAVAVLGGLPGVSLGVQSTVPRLRRIDLDPASVILALGGQSNLKASAYFAEQPKSVNFTTKVEWVSSDPARVSVDRLGAATCLAAGTVVVSARDPVTGVTSTATGRALRASASPERRR